MGEENSKNKQDLEPNGGFVEYGVIGVGLYMAFMAAVALSGGARETVQDYGLHDNTSVGAKFTRGAVKGVRNFHVDVYDAIAEIPSAIGDVLTNDLDEPN